MLLAEIVQSYVQGRARTETPTTSLLPQLVLARRRWRLVPPPDQARYRPNSPHRLSAGEPWPHQETPRTPAFDLTQDLLEVLALRVLEIGGHLEAERPHQFEILLEPVRVVPVLSR